MHPDLRRYLDGELAREALTPELVAQAHEWDVLLGAARSLPAERAPAWLESAVMRSIPLAPDPMVVRAGWRWTADARDALGRAWAWLIEPHSVQLRPIGVAFAAAAAAAVIALWPGAPAPAGESPMAATLPVQAVASAPGLVYVQFVFASDQAQSVAVAGDFNGWEPMKHQLRDADADGVWTGLVALPPGVHKYMFVVDGEEWQTDPNADQYVDDGFGMRNAIVAVNPPNVRAS